MRYGDVNTINITDRGRTPAHVFGYSFRMTNLVGAEGRARLRRRTRMIDEKVLADRRLLTNIIVWFKTHPDAQKGESLQDFLERKFDVTITPSRTGYKFKFRNLDEETQFLLMFS
jgi:hypothetical protein